MYTIEIEKRCLRELKQLDKSVVSRAFDILETVIAKDPYAGKELKGKYKGLFSYRLSDYRIVFDIKMKQLIILILRIRHRKNVYDGL
ncbi:MAG TPA: type II toxin-antitoxin system RelE/ParE family toxin [Spirochaetes bacterium]|nr:type II toxin-antitoxin system RelE/ParE family toxin [Spirochaetota bacterium]